MRQVLNPVLFHPILPAFEGDVLCLLLRFDSPASPHFSFLSDLSAPSAPGMGLSHRSGCFEVQRVISVLKPFSGLMK